ncbi:hypothetical protein G6F50_017332 [Rhizopus delemar]|uniref:MmgE/PrpD N-terminal domain-containing protein n=1 Tax=Rhizopus delemar TaxID=936053 RepID=A0A9P6XQQ4_9FUNG|nr:hypothetical protein G6F50_017332 [Rhizopus delemar]
MVRWLDFNDTWLAAEWGHPSDNLGGILAVCDWLGRNAQALRARDPRRAGPAEFVQPGRVGPCGAGQGGHHGGGRAPARAGSRTHAQCAVAGLG